MGVWLWRPIFAPPLPHIEIAHLKTLWTIKQERKPEITETKYETFHSSQSEVFCSEILAASLQSPVLPEAEQPYQPLVLLPHKTFKVMIRLTEFVVRSLNKVHVVHASISMWAQTHISVGESNCLVSASFVKQDHGMDLQTFGQRTCSWQNSCMSMYGLFASTKRNAREATWNIFKHATHPTRSLFYAHSTFKRSPELRLAKGSPGPEHQLLFLWSESTEKSDSEGRECTVI